MAMYIYIYIGTVVHVSVIENGSVLIDTVGSMSARQLDYDASDCHVWSP